MTRSDLLQYLEEHRKRGFGRRTRLSVILTIFLAIGLFMVGSGQVEMGLSILLIFGGGGGLYGFMRLLTPRPSYQAGRLEADLPPTVVAATFVAMAAMGAGGFLLWGQLHGFRKIEVAAVGVAWLAAMVAMPFIALRRNPVVVIDGAGYFDRRAMRRAVPWDKIGGVVTTEFRGQVSHRLLVNDREALNPGTRLVLSGGQGVLLSGMGLTVSETDLLLAIQAHRPALLDPLRRSTAR